MIILQLLSFLLLIPLSLAMLIIFNIYTHHGLYLLLVTVFALLYAAFWGLVFISVIPIYIVFSIWLFLYIWRMLVLQNHFKSVGHERGMRTIAAQIKIPSVKLNLKFLFSLSFLKIFKILPRSLNLKLTISHLIDLILLNSIGTHIHICTEEAEVQLTIQ